MTETPAPYVAADPADPAAGACAGAFVAPRCQTCAGRGVVDVQRYTYCRALDVYVLKLVEVTCEVCHGKGWTFR